MFDIVSALPAKRKSSSNGWIAFNAPCCHHRGERPDSRGRGGIITGPDGFTFHCFNCGFKARYKRGDRLSFRARQFLIWLGVDEATIDMIQLESMRHRTLNGLLPDEEQPVVRPQRISFPTVELPADLELLTSDTESHLKYIDYLKGRHLSPWEYPYMAYTDESRHPRPGFVIPYTYHGEIVGHVTRHLDDGRPKYVHEMPSGYVFGVDLQREHWQRVLVVEGVLDAIAIDGVAVLHNEVNADQARLITQLNREVIVVPDMDHAGDPLIERAIELGWSVSLPRWEQDVKDVADAVGKYGKLATLITIMDSVETNPLKIKIRRKKFAKKYH